MRLKVRLTFNDQQRQVITDFCKEVSMTAEEFCKRAVFYAINRAYADAEQLRQREEVIRGGHNATGGITPGDSGSGLQPQSDVNPAALPNPEVVSNPDPQGSPQV